MGVSTSSNIPDIMTTLAWDDLFYYIKKGRCIPFIGPNVSKRWIDLDQIAKKWAESYSYPYITEDYTELPQIAQYIAIMEGDMTVKNLLSMTMDDLDTPNFSLPEHQNTVYSVLADLNLPIYITTNYDQSMEKL